MIIEEGKLFYVGTGEYSDYSVFGTFKALKNIDTKQLIAHYKDLGLDKSHAYDEPECFMGWLTKSGYIEDVEMPEWYLGSYGQIR